MLRKRLQSIAFIESSQNAKMKKLLSLLWLISAAVFLVLLDGGNLTEAACSLRLYRSPDRSSAMIRINDDHEYIYLSLVDIPDHPAIQFYVKGDQVVVFDRHARAEVKTKLKLQTADDLVSSQFQHFCEQFYKIPSGSRIYGRSLRQNQMFRQGNFQVDWLPGKEYLLTIRDIPEFSLFYKESDGQNYYAIKSPLAALETRVDSRCQVQVYRQGAQVELVWLRPRRDPVQRPPRSAQDWNPMDQSSWTLFDNQNQQASSASGTQSQSGFRFARPLLPLEPAEPEAPAEPGLFQQEHN